MSQEQWTAVDRYCADLQHAPDPALDEALRSSAAAGLPSIAVSPNLGKLLHLLARNMGARLILEIGTLGGYSTSWPGRARPAAGGPATRGYERRPGGGARGSLARGGRG